MDLKSGDIVYTSPVPGSTIIIHLFPVASHVCVLCHIAGALLKVWVGAYCSALDGLAVLACVALNGFHSVVHYGWRRNGNVMPGEDKPLLVSGPGAYECLVAHGSLTLTRKFLVSG